MAPIRIESTASCGAVPALFFIAAELGLDITLHVRDDGAFLAEDGRPGPAITIGGERVVGLRPAIERLFAELAPELRDPAARLFDGWVGALGPSIRAYISARGEPERASALREHVEQQLDRAEEHMRERQWLIDGPTAVDALAMILPRLAALGFDSRSRWPNLAALVARLVTRPAYVRASELAARLAAAAPVGHEDVLAWWFGEPAQTPAELDAKVERWFLAGWRLDDEVRERFGPTIDRALRGSLDDWAQEPRGRLALILVLDQLTRHAFRDTPRAYVGDARAQTLCMEGLDRGVDAELSAIQRTFFIMPLTHAEDLRLQDRAVAVREAALTAGSHPLDEIGLEQARKHRDVVRRFGRFPHRNTVLGRTSTPQELEYLRAEIRSIPPSRYRERASELQDQRA